MRRTRADLTAAQTGLLAIAALAVGLALQIRQGEFTPLALALIGVAVVLTLATVADVRPLELNETVVVMVLGVTLTVEMVALVAQPVALDIAPSSTGNWRFFALLALAGGSLLVIALGPPRLRRWAIPLLLAAHFGAGVWILRHAAPATDVFVFQRGSLEALLHGRDPYAIKFRNIYHPNESFYGPGLVVRGILQFGYPYPPLPLFLTAPALLAGDIRYAHLAALTLGATALAYAQKGRVAPLAAGLLLFSPRFGLLLQMSWTEPFVILFFGLTVLCALWLPGLLPLAFGLLLATKQYLVLLAPAVYLLVPPLPDAHERWRRAVVIIAEAVGVAALVTLPLALWNLPAFVRSVVTLQFHQPFRNDALSVLVPLARAGLPRDGLAWLPFALAPAALVFALRRAPRTPAGFALTTAATYLVFFAFNKQAFCNYYFFPLAALCAAVAATPHGPTRSF